MDMFLKNRTFLTFFVIMSAKMIFLFKVRGAEPEPHLKITAGAASFLARSDSLVFSFFAGGGAKSSLFFLLCRQGRNIFFSSSLQVGGDYVTFLQIIFVENYSKNISKKVPKLYSNDIKVNYEKYFFEKELFRCKEVTQFGGGAKSRFFVLLCRCGRINQVFLLCRWICFVPSLQVESQHLVVFLLSRWGHKIQVVFFFADGGAKCIFPSLSVRAHNLDLSSLQVGAQN